MALDGDLAAYSRLCLDTLLARPIGLLSILEEEVKFPSANKSSLLNKLEANLSGSKVFTKDKTSDVFVIRHFAEPVIYNPDGVRSCRSSTFRRWTPILNWSE